MDNKHVFGTLYDGAPYIGIPLVDDYDEGDGFLPVILNDVNVKAKRLVDNRRVDDVLNNVDV